MLHTRGQRGGKGGGGGSKRTENLATSTHGKNTLQTGRLTTE